MTEAQSLIYRGDYRAAREARRRAPVPSPHEIRFAANEARQRIIDIQNDSMSVKLDAVRQFLENPDVPRSASALEMCVDGLDI